MNDEQKARLAELDAKYAGKAMWIIQSTVEARDAAWLLALVKELAEENARFRRAVTNLLDANETIERVSKEQDALEQQLAAVTAERDAARSHLDVAHKEIESLVAERDELKRALEATHTAHQETAKRALPWRERAKKAEAERDTLRAELANAKEAIIEYYERHIDGYETVHDSARELARLKGEKGGG